MSDLKLSLQGMPDVKAYMKGIESQIPYATALGLTRTSKAVQSDLVNRMHKVFDRPTRGTLNSLFTRPATKKYLQSSIGIKDFAPKGTPAVKYLAAQIEGGLRQPKRSERALKYRGKLRGNQYLVPGRDAKLNKFGNVNAQQVVRALSNIGGQNDIWQNTSPKSAARSKRRGARQYFFIKDKGVFWRQGKTLKSFLAVAKQPTYKQRFDFYGDGVKSANRHLPEQMRNAMIEAITTGRVQR